MCATPSFLPLPRSGDMYNDESAAITSASSVFFTVLVVAQMGHLLSVRRKIPYFADACVPGLSPRERAQRILRGFKPRFSIVCAWVVSVITMNALNEGPALQSLCGTGR